VMDSTHTPANQTVEPGAIVFIKDPYETGYTDEEIRLLLTGRADEVGRPKAALIAAADVQTGAMIAFIPREEDAQRLAISDGESTQQLHTTSIYLGDAVDIPNDVRAEIIETMVDCANGCEPIVANVFGFSILNPDGEEPCLVANVGGQELWDAQQMIIEISDEMDWASPDQHQPWLAHITLIYSADPRASLTDDVLSRTGPIIYDRIRVAFAGVITDIPLGDGTLTAAGLHTFHLPGKHNQATHGHGLGAHASDGDVQRAGRLNAGKKLDANNPEDRELLRGIAGWTGGGHSALTADETPPQSAMLGDIGHVLNGHPDAPGPAGSFLRSVAGAPEGAPELYRGMHGVSLEDVPSHGDVFDLGPTSFTRSKSVRDRFSDVDAPAAGGLFGAYSTTVHYRLKKGAHALRIDKHAGTYAWEDEHVTMGRFRVTGRTERFVTPKGSKTPKSLIEIDIEQVPFDTPTTRGSSGKSVKPVIGDMTDMN
jgi:2'-5' RNA ligase